MRISDADFACIFCLIALDKSAKPPPACPKCGRPWTYTPVSEPVYEEEFRYEETGGA